MNLATTCLRVTLATVALASLGVSAPAATLGTRYFVDVAGASAPLPIGAFSSDARADVSSYSYGGDSGTRAAHGKFSIRANGSPFATSRSFASMVVLAQTPTKLVTLTFTNVTIDAADATSKNDERVTFESENYTVRIGAK